MRARTVDVIDKLQVSNRLLHSTVNFPNKTAACKYFKFEKIKNWMISPGSGIEAFKRDESDFHCERIPNLECISSQTKSLALLHTYR